MNINFKITGTCPDCKKEISGNVSADIDAEIMAFLISKIDMGTIMKLMHNFKK